MGKTTIKVICSDQQLVAAVTPTIASGGINEDRIEFEFCPLWNGFGKTAIFYRDAKEAVYHVPLENDACIIPHEVLADEGWMYFGVFGHRDDMRRTSVILKYRVEDGAITGEAVTPSEPTPDVYAQILAQIGALEQFTTSPGKDYEVSGASVTVNNYEGMPIHVVTRIDINQQGAGDPSSINVRPIVSPDQATLTLNGATVGSTEFGHSVCSGSYEWDKGVLTEDMVIEVFDGSEDEVIGSASDSDRIPDGGYYLTINFKTLASGTSANRAKSLCNVAKYVTNLYESFYYNTYSISPNGNTFNIKPDADFVSANPFPFDLTGDEKTAAIDAIKANFCAWLADNPVQIAYIPAEERVTALPVQRIYAVEGANTIASSVGSVTVSGRMDIRAITADLAERVTALEARLAALTE